MNMRRCTKLRFHSFPRVARDLRARVPFRGGAACSQDARSDARGSFGALGTTRPTSEMRGQRLPSNPQSGLRTPQSHLGFSLIEVVFAVGIFATVIISVIGLLGPTVRSVRDVVDSTIAARLADGVDAELRRVGFAGVVAATAGNATIPLVATVDGSRIVSETNAGNAPTTTPPGIPLAERYYLVEVRRVVSPAYAAGDASLVLTIRVTWPYQQPGAAGPVAAADRSIFIFNTAITP
jgi:type II secretory pathway pseudopilin PulG